MATQDDLVTIGLAAARAATGREITYHRGTDAPATFSAIRGRFQAERMAGDFVTGTADLVDWLFPVAELAGEPSESDWMAWDGRRYDLADVPGLRAWGWVDPAETWVRVHTVRTGPAPTTTTTTTTAP